MAARGRKKAEEPATLPIRKAQERPEPPDDFKGEALKAWGSLCDDLAAQGSLDRADRKLIEIYCRTYPIYLRVSKALEDEEIVKVSMGRAFLNPLVGAASDLSTKLRACLADLNLTTKARKPPKVEPTEVDPVGDFLGIK